MAIDIGTLQGTLALNDQFSAGINGAKKQVDSFGESFAGVTKFAGIAVGAIAGVAGAIATLGMRGSDVADVRGAFEGLAARAGESADVMLGKLNEGTLNTISNFELMRIASTVLSSGLALTSDDMGTLAKGAQLLADRTGGSAVEALGKLAEAMAKGTSKQADLKFMFRDSDIAVADYAASIGKLPKDLSDAETATAKSQGALKNLRDELDKTGPATADFGDRVAQGRKALQDLFDTTALVTEGALMDLASQLGNVAGGAGTVQEVVSTTANVVANGFVNMASIGVGAIKGLVEAMTAGAGTIGSTANTMWDILTGKVGVAEGLATIGTLASKGFGAIKDGLTEALSPTLTFKDYTMRAAEAVQVLGNAAPEAAKRSIENSKAIAESYRKLEEELALIGRVGLDRKLMELKFAHEAEVRAIGELKGIRTEEAQAQVRLSEERYAKEVEAAKAGGDEILIATQNLEDEVALMKTTGLDNQLLQIEQHRRDEIDGLIGYKEEYRAKYDELVTLVNEKYGIMSADAVQSFAIQTEAAVSWRDSAIEAANKVLENAEANLARLAATKGTTEQAMADAHAVVAKAEDDLDAAVTKNKLDRFDMIASSASGILKSIFGKSKAAAIAAAIIDMAAGVVKCFAQYGWPWGLIPAAAIEAAGIIQIAKIKSQDIGFATGSDGFQDFGRGTAAMLHGEERVQTLAQAVEEQELVAREIRALGDRLASRQETIHVPLTVDGKLLADVLVRRNRAGLFRVVSA